MSEIFGKQVDSIPSWWKTIGISFICLLLILATIWFEQPSTSKDENASNDQFSAARAIKHIEAMAKHPHPVGSDANAEVRTYVLKQMELLGLPPSVDTYHWSGDDINGEFKSYDIYNIVGIRKGTKPGKALMLTAHYDSVPDGPGANDDVSGVATLLETARILQAGPPSERDIWFVFTDGEEAGMLGAKEFWKESKHRDAIGLVANFEARGSSGPSIMFQTSPENGMLISELSSIAKYPVSNSMLGNMYQKMPNYTDLNVSIQEGIPGLDFAYIGGWDKYHTAEDTPENVSLASLQHHGENALAVAQRFGNMNLDNLNEPDHVYFNWFGLLVHYPKSLVKPITSLIGIMLVLSIAVLLKRGTITAKRIAFSLLAIVGGGVLSAAISYLLYLGITQVGGLITGVEIDPEKLPTQLNLIFIAVVLIVHLFVSRWMNRVGNVLEMTLSGMVFYFLLLVTMLRLIPGASYLFMVPLVVHCVVICWNLHKSSPVKTLQRPWMILILAIVPLTLTTSLLHLLYTGLPLKANALVTVLCIVTFSLLQPLFSNLSSIRVSQLAHMDNRQY
ncbi:M20/M25/M40 family metallo-hydrolase [Paenibacillus lautus]|uniref:M20/M25/M40 family metallo-hydrolase n=1 Tax=Paenibacillus lautus TaxID=1401 RepID=UPI003D2B46F2